MLESLRLPADLTLVRTTSEFSVGSVPAGLLRAHRVAEGVWGLLRVRDGTVVFVAEETGEARTLTPGDAQVVPPGVIHHVELDEAARFVLEFHR